MANNYVCVKCGHLVVSESQPSPTRWTDGHVCYFKLETPPQPEIEPGCAHITSREQYLEVRRVCKMYGGDFWQDKVTCKKSGKVYRYLRVKNISKPYILYYHVIGILGNSQGLKLNKSGSPFGWKSKVVDSVSVRVPNNVIKTN